MGTNDKSSLYLRWRPNRFADLIGQAVPAKVLAANVTADTPGQAFLLSGPRGTGKTSSARILAKALNCADVDRDGEPCNACDSCRAVDNGSSLAVTEIDAASHNGVDHMRDLVSKANLTGAGRYRVYVLDEAHMLSVSAANVLLKPLEEPPGNVVWILATTEPHRILDTIRSRTRHLPFRLVDRETMTAHLEHIAKTEGLDAGPAEITEAVRRGGGSVRDTLSAFEVIVTGGIAADGDDSTELVDALLRKDLAGCLTAVARSAADGADMRILAERAVGTLRDVFLVQMGTPDLISASGAERTDWVDAGPKVTVAAIDALGDAIVSMRAGHDARIALDVNVARHCHRS